MYDAILNREVVSDAKICKLVGVGTFIIFMVLGAFVRIPLPFTPVPWTLQTFFVLLSGAMLAGNLGAISQAGYAVLGIAGLPVFVNAGSGGAYLLGPTGGYIAGFIIASFFLGRTIKTFGNSLFSVFFLMCFADALLLLTGALWLKILLGCGTEKALAIGFLPFIPGDLFKAAAAAIIYIKIRPRIRKIF